MSSLIGSVLKSVAGSAGGAGLLITIALPLAKIIYKRMRASGQSDVS